MKKDDGLEIGVKRRGTHKKYLAFGDWGTCGMVSKILIRFLDFFFSSYQQTTPAILYKVSRIK
jgi:hypothetical protein